MPPRKCLKAYLVATNFVVLWLLVGSSIHIIDYGSVYKGDIYDPFTRNVLQMTMQINTAKKLWNETGILSREPIEDFCFYVQMATLENS